MWICTYAYAICLCIHIFYLPIRTLHVSCVAVTLFIIRMRACPRRFSCFVNSFFFLSLSRFGFCLVSPGGMPGRMPTHRSRIARINMRLIMCVCVCPVIYTYKYIHMLCIPTIFVHIFARNVHVELVNAHVVNEKQIAIV